MRPPEEEQAFGRSNGFGDIDLHSLTFRGNETARIFVNRNDLCMIMRGISMRPTFIAAIIFSFLSVSSFSSVSSDDDQNPAFIPKTNEKLS